MLNIHNYLYVEWIDETYTGITCTCQLHCQHVETEWFLVKLTWSTRQKPSQRHQSFFCTSNCLSIPRWLCRLHYRSVLLPGVCKHALTPFSQAVASAEKLDFRDKVWKYTVPWKKYCRSYQPYSQRERNIDLLFVLISSLVHTKASNYLYWLACHFKVHKLHGNFIVHNGN